MCSKPDGTNKYKLSRYNHFVELDEGKRLAFNAISCGLAEMDDKTFHKLQALTNGDGQDGVDEELLKNLKMGNFIVPEDVDELDILRAGHYRARFGNDGFGLTIIPTLRCNFACDYCYENSDLHSQPISDVSVMSKEVRDNVVKLCEARIAEKSAFTVTWYGGEPLLAKDVIADLTDRFKAVCETKDSQFHAGIITNGYLLTRDTLDFLIDHGVTFAQVTIDGPKEIHDQRRCLRSGGGTYDRIMANLANLNEDMPFRVSIRVNVDQRNQQHIPELLDDLKERGLHRHRIISLHFSPTVHYSNSCPDIANRCLTTKSFSETEVAAYRAAISKGFEISVFPAAQIGTCGAVSSNSLVIEPNGCVKSC